MTTKEAILDALHRHQEGTLGVIRATCDDCIDIVASVPDTEMAMSRTIADLMEAVGELEDILEEVERGG